MYQNNNYLTQQPNAISQQQAQYIPTYLRQSAPPGLKGRPVSSLDEVRATTIDFDGSVFFFPDLANGKIYTKQINMDGTATTNMYELKPIPTAPAIGANDNNYITRDEFEAALVALKSSLMQPVETVQPKPEIKSF